MIPANIKAVSFDAGGTLLRPRPSVGHVYAQVARRHGWDGLDPDELTRRFADAWRNKETFNYSRPEWAALVATIFQGLVKRPEDPDFFDHLYRAFEQPEHWELYSDVQLALEGLTQVGYRLLITSNWDERLHNILDSLGIAGHFATVIVSLEAGCTKPDPAVFHHAADRMRLKPDEILHVGDSKDEDLVGASESGMAAFLVDREAGQCSAPVISSLLDLLPVDRFSSILPMPGSGQRS